MRPQLPPGARPALIGTGALSVVNAGTLVAQAFLLASALAAIVGGEPTPYVQLAVLSATVIIRALTGWAIRVVAARAAAGAKEELRARAVDHALRLGPEWVADRGPAQLTALTTKGLDALDAYFTDYLPALVTAAVVPLGAGAAVLFADWPSAVIIAITVPLLPMFAILVGKHTADKVAGQSEALARLSGHLLELVRALPVLAAFRRADAQGEAVRRVSEKHRRATVGTLRVAFSSAFVLELAATLSVALIAVTIGVRLVSGDMSLAIGLGVLILAPDCYQPLRNVGSAFHASEDGVEAVRRVTGLLDEPVHEPRTGTTDRGVLRIDGLRVRRRGRFAPDGHTLTAEPGELTWLTGPSGAGKSTVFGVLLGFVPAESGAITVDDRPAGNLRRSAAWIPQSPTFTGGTVRAELVLACADLDIEPGDAAILAALSEMDIAENAGVPVNRLSTGQRQRVAVARALLRIRHGAWLLLADEPTAHLDATTAKLVDTALHRVADEGATVLIAAHQRQKNSFLVTETVTPRGVPAASGEIGRPIPLRTLVDRRLLGGATLGAVALICGIALTATSGWLIARASQQPPILTLTVAVVSVRAFGLGRAVLRYCERLVTHDAAFRVAADLRVRLWSALVRRGPADTLDLRRGEGQRRLVGDIDTLRDLLPRVLTPPLVTGAVVLVAVAVSTAVLPVAGLTLAGICLLAAILAPSATVWAERHATGELAEGRRAVTAGVLALFESAAELLAFGAAADRRAALSEVDTRLVRTARGQAFGAGIGDAIVVLCTGFAAVVLTALGGAAVTSGHLDPIAVPLLALIPLALAEVLATLPAAAQHADALRDTRIRLASAMTNSTAEGDDVTNRNTPSTGTRGLAEPISVRGDLAWPGNPEPVLRDLALRIEPGNRIALIGPSGSGKSTILAGLLGFIPGADSLPDNISWAPQEPQLVSTTVAENLRLADPRATDERLREVLDGLALGELELDTVLGNAGAGLSGGQAQRLALGRALLAAPDADLVLIDEPTAHLDPATAARVRQTLTRELAGRTVVLATHDPVDTVDFDAALHVEGGRVRDLSAYSELAADLNSVLEAA